MKFFDAAISKINSCSRDTNTINLYNISTNQFSCFLEEYLNQSKITQHLIVTDTPEQASQLYQIIKNNLKNYYSTLFPSLSLSIYDNFYSSESDLIKKWEILQMLNMNQPILIVADITSALEISPPKSFFSKFHKTLEVSQIISPLDLSKELSEIGYVHMPTLGSADGNDGNGPGHFSKKGEIFDIYPMALKPIRIFYFDDMIERIACVDPITLRTLPDQDLDHLQIMPAPLILSKKEFTLNLRERLPRILDRSCSKFAERQQIFLQLKENMLFNNYPIYSPLFFNDNNCLLDYFIDSFIFTLNKEDIFSQFLFNLEELENNYQRCKEDPESDCLLPAPDIYFNNTNLLKQKKLLNFCPLKIEYDIEENLAENITFNFKDLNFLVNSQNISNDIHHNLSNLVEKLVEHFKYVGKIVFCYSSKKSKDEFLFLIEENLKNFNSNLLSRLSCKNLELDKSFYDENNKILFLSENEIYQKKKTRKVRKSKKQNIDLFAEQMASLEKGDYVIHSTFGTGVYLGLEQIPFGDNLSDYLVIEYKNNDKIYVPVFKMDLVQKQADGNAKLVVNNLRSNKFDQLKKRAKESAKKLAFDLIKLQAKRESYIGFTFSPPDLHYREFETACPFTLTSDQHVVMTDILDDMCSSRPMDRLICGDVGFGKTELAMRAAFKAILDKKQVAILVPTTILALQHFESFKERFKHFPVNIDFLSRFKTRKEEVKTLKNLMSGKIDIIIGTHKLLGKSIVYNQLGLVIVDEEHRFGVSHKEKLKLYKETVDFLNLTATPIPRTLQLSFLGIRKISLIQTPPPKRQPIKTYLIKSDQQTIKHAIDKELKRGGQVYIVHNRVKDMASFAMKIKEICPNAKIVVAHAQMNEKELETKIKDFYHGKFQILIATTIIESGIDIPNANTMIVDQADHFGLAQLHQLRGRIGRSDRRAYAYFIVSKNKITKDAEKRLKAIQTYSDIGTGFHLANCDLEIRGAGNILGAEQSGHVEKIGLELYVQLLKDAVNELKGEKDIIRKDIELSTPFSASIPDNYIEDSKERLKQYKKLSNCTTEDQIDQLIEYFDDVYGKLPTSVHNLSLILKSKLYLSVMPLKSAKVIGQKITYQFIKENISENKHILDLIINFCIKNPKTYKLTPDYKMIILLKEKMTPEHFLQHSKDIAQLLKL